MRTLRAARSPRAWAAALLLAGLAAASTTRAQTAVVTHDVNVRARQSRSRPVLGVLLAGDTVPLLSAATVHGYYEIETRDTTTRGWVYARYLRLVSNSSGQPDTARVAAAGIHGSRSVVGCGDHRWRHVYHPTRLLIRDECLTVTGTIVDASHHRYRDGARHEADGDTHAWIQLDSAYRGLLDAGNEADEGGNLVFEIVCHYGVTQADAKTACARYTDHTALPPVGTHVAITGTYVEDLNHGRWNEIHPVSGIAAAP